MLLLKLNRFGCHQLCEPISQDLIVMINNLLRAQATVAPSAMRITDQGHCIVFASRTATGGVDKVIRLDACNHQLFNILGR